MKRLIPYFLFYRSYAIWSLATTFIMVVAEFQLISIACSKILLAYMLWHWLDLHSGKKAIDYIVKQELSTSQFFGIIYIIDLIISLPFLLILKEFV